ncbi:hypothetical protein JTE90_022257 [Oedothorax gibbosus]|uniref:Uncharacterized protein n=1 Tax=Oedothorax gibbosus TaxID=931172 RepID=A0AAV6VVM8_9ARAC|nr:hypothetical protein JTE90_022257 [Oedothorax gibbosus]
MSRLRSGVVFFLLDGGVFLKRLSLTNIQETPAENKRGATEEVHVNATCRSYFRFGSLVYYIEELSLRTASRDFKSNQHYAEPCAKPPFFGPVVHLILFNTEGGGFHSFFYFHSVLFSGICLIELSNSSKIYSRPAYNPPSTMIFSHIFGERRLKEHISSG